MTSNCIATVLGISVILVATARAGDSLSFADLAGTYVSSLDGGCLLELRKDSTYMITCGKRPPRKGQTLFIDGGFSVGTGPIPEAIGMPPSAPGDPTRGPYVVRVAEEPISLWLEPLRWGDRLYLIRGGEQTAFCRSIRSGLEPRAETTGDEFLRRGDHRRAAGPKPPRECEKFK